MKNNKTNQPLFAEGIWRQHRNKHQLKAYWSKQRWKVKQEIEEELEESWESKDNK